MTVRPRWRPYSHVKRGVDLLITVALLPLIVLVMIACAVAIRLDSPGPIFFSQVRTGRDGKRFRMLKFRTMVENAEELKASLAHLSIVPPPDFKLIDDPRITRVGGFLRAASLDEVPQFINVLLGHMSVVGPRPTSFEPATYALWHTERLEARPGITGLWQVKGRNETTFDERLRLDIAYLDGMSFRLDLTILLLTIGAVVRRSGA